MTRLVLATGNRGKIEELRAFLGGLPVEVMGYADFPGIVPADEDGTTFAENALKKARAVCAQTGLPALADDSGLEVDALGGRPGVLSARYAGPEADDAANNARLLAEMALVPPGRRSARYRVVLALVLPDGREFTCEGVSEGEILAAPRGSGGFGYDPVFYVPELDKTFAELSPAERRERSHRFRALRAFRPVLEKALGLSAN